MQICPPWCGVKLPELATMMGSDQAVLALVGLVLAAILCVAVYRRLRPAQ